MGNTGIKRNLLGGIGVGLKDKYRKIRTFPIEEFFTNSNRVMFSGKRQAGISTDEGVKSVGDYELRRPCLTPDGKWACFERGRTNRMRDECPIYTSKVGEV